MDEEGNYRIKARGRTSYLLALDIMEEMSDPRCKLVGPDTGNSCTQYMGGRKYICKRTKYGGIDVHEVGPSHSGMTAYRDQPKPAQSRNSPTHGWDEVYGGQK